jgi:hypothetical protein
VQDGAHLLRGQIDRGLAVIAADEAVSVLMPFDLAFDFAQQGGAGQSGAGLGYFFDDKILGCCAQVAELVDALVSGTSG